VIAPAKEAVDTDGLENVLKGQTNAKKITVLSPERSQDGSGDGAGS